MKLSVVVSILDSHEIVRRQILHFAKMELTNEIEIIFLDDGSDPPLDFKELWPHNLKIYRCNFSGKWTQGLARNYGASLAKGEYLLMTDLDHIISKRVMLECLDFTGDKMVFFRELGVLTEDAVLTQELSILQHYGLSMPRYKRRKFYCGVHGNTWLMKHSLFVKLGMYCEKRASCGSHLMGEDREFNRRYMIAVRKGLAKPQVSAVSPIYMFPNGRYHKTGDDNPLGLWHGLKHTKWGEADE